MARHRSPQGRRAHLGLPLPSVATAAGAGGHALPAAGGLPTAPRVIATVLAGGALAAAGQTALSGALPAASDGANVLKLGVQQLIGTPPATPDAGAALVPADVVSAAGPAAPVTAPTAVAPLVALPAAASPVAPEPAPVDVRELVKATELHRRAADEAARATARERDSLTADVSGLAGRVAAAADDDVAGALADAVTGSRSGGAEGVQMVVGRVSSGFGARWGRSHNGIDVAAPIGTPIHAPLAGEVVASGPASGFGLWVRVRHDDGTVTTYGHINRSLVRVGERVAAGEEIAEVGNRGRSTGPHLHMEVETPGGATVNPRPWLDAHGIGY